MHRTLSILGLLALAGFSEAARADDAISEGADAEAPSCRRFAPFASSSLPLPACWSTIRVHSP